MFGVLEKFGLELIYWFQLWGLKFDFSALENTILMFSKFRPSEPTSIAPVTPSLSARDKESDAHDHVRRRLCVGAS